MNDINATLAERGARYGNFEDQAAIAQALQRILSRNVGWLKLADDQREAMQMICAKMARIINGDPNYADNWVDIEGYARLVARRLEGK